MVSWTVFIENTLSPTFCDGERETDRERLGAVGWLHQSSYDIDVSIWPLALLSVAPGAIEISVSGQQALGEDALE